LRRAKANAAKPSAMENRPSAPRPNCSRLLMPVVPLPVLGADGEAAAGANDGAFENAPSTAEFSAGAAALEGNVPVLGALGLTLGLTFGATFGGVELRTLVTGAGDVLLMGDVDVAGEPLDGGLAVVPVVGDVGLVGLVGAVMLNGKMLKSNGADDASVFTNSHVTSSPAPRPIETVPVARFVVIVEAIVCPVQLIDESVQPLTGVSVNEYEPAARPENACSFAPVVPALVSVKPLTPEPVSVNTASGPWSAPDHVFVIVTLLVPAAAAVFVMVQVRLSPAASVTAPVLSQSPEKVAV